MSKAGSPIRLRAILLGVILAVAICAETPINNIYHQATPLGGGHFPLAPFFIFFILAIITAIVNTLIKPRRVFHGAELLVIWIQMVIGSGIAYTGLARTFLINLTAPVHFASMGNRWEEMLTPLIPPALIPTSKEAIELLYNGLPTGREMGWFDVFLAIPWHAWMRPLLLWGLFIFLCYLVIMLLINLISRQWIHNERLNFPLLKVPETVGKSIDENGFYSFITNKFFLLGLLIPVFLHLLNGLSFYYPSIPHIQTLVLAGPYFPDYGIFSGFHKLKLYFYPAFIGFAFLASRQISFSFWFFFLFGGLFYGLLGVAGYSIPASELGTSFGPTLTRPEEMQMIGAYGVFFLFLVWLARYHLLEVTKESLFLTKHSKNRTEWFDVRISFWGVIFGFAAIIYWFIYLGMPPFAATLLVFAFFMIMMVATRIICQGGLPYFTLTAAPIDGLLTLFGTKMYAGTSGLLAGMAQKALFVDLRESLMPSVVHGRKIHHGKSPASLLFFGLGLTVLASTLVSVGAMMTLCYKFGIRELELEWATRTTITVFENVFRLTFSPLESGEWVTTFAIGGALFMLVLVFCYHKFYWWPIHPIGYLTAYSSAMRILWVSFFIGWACNTLCMRYGGVVLFKKFQLFFIGLIVGDFLMGGSFAIVGIFTDTSYQVLPD